MIAIVDYGVGNLFSLKSSFAAIGSEAVVTGEAAVLRAAERILLPGVDSQVFLGEFGIRARVEFLLNGLHVEGKARQRQGIGDRSVGIEIRAGCLPESGRCGQGQRERRQKQGLFHNYFHLLCVQR